LGFSFKIRPGAAADIEAVSRAYAQAWRETYAPFAPPIFTQGMSEAAASRIFHESLAPNAFSYFLFVAEVEGRIVGFADGGRERSRPDSGEGELYALYLLKEFHGRGIGRELFKAALSQLGRSGLGSAVAWVLERNPTRRFYEKAQGALGPDQKRLVLGGETVNLVSYRWALRPVDF